MLIGATLCILLVMMSIVFVHDAFFTVVNVHAPIQQLRVRGLDNPCMKGDIKGLIHQRNLRLKILRSTDWIKYKELRNKVTGGLLER